MRLAEIIRANKGGVNFSKWQIGKVPNASFPLTKKSALPAGSEWSWLLIESDALNRHFRVLIRLNEVKEFFLPFWRWMIQEG